MFPWYSGTSADMYKTMLDLTISVKLFLGRFDMRTMQARHDTNKTPLLGDLQCSFSRYVCQACRCPMRQLLRLHSCHAGCTSGWSSPQ